MKRDILKYIPSIIIPTLVGVVAVKFYTNIYTDIEYQKYIFFIGIFSFIQALSSSWIGSSVIRYYENFKLEKEEFGFKVVSSCICVLSTIINLIFLSLWLYFFENAILNSLNLFLLIPFSLLSTLSEVRLNFLRANRKIKFYNTIIVIRSFLLPVIVLVWFYFQNVRINLIVASLITQVLVLLLTFIFNEHYQKVNRLGQIQVKKIARKILFFGIPLAPTFLVSNAIEIVEKVLINARLKSGDLSIYFVAQTFSKNPISLITSALVLSTAPAIVSTFENEGKEAAKLLLIQLYKFFIVLTWPMFAFILIFNEELILFFSNSNYLQGAVLMPYLAISSFFLGIQWISQRVLLLYEKTKLVLICFAFSLVVFCILSHYLVSRFGLIGISIANMIASIFAFLFVFLLSQRFLRIKIAYLSILKFIFYLVIYAFSYQIYFLIFGAYIISKSIFFILSISFSLYYFYSNLNKLKFRQK